MKPVRLLSMLGVAALSFAIPFTAGATVRKEGSWPTAETKVDLKFDGKPSAGLKKLARAADWSLVVANGVAMDESGSDIHVDVDDQPADAVLEALFVGRDVIAYRNGTLVTVTPANEGGSAPNGAAPPIVATPPILPAPSALGAGAIPAPPVPTMRGEDRNVFGGSLVIRKDEVVHTVTIAGGSLKVEGTVTGDLVVAGGSAKIMSGGHVVGNATVFGGSLTVQKDARVDGDVGVAGGLLQREEGAIIGGKVVDDDHDGRVNITVNDDGTKANVIPHEDSGRSRVAEGVHEFGRSISKMALLFILGCVLLALLAQRMDKVRLELASRPMRSFAVGLVATLFGSIGAAIVVTILCITVVGIPIAVMGILLAIIAFYGAVASVLTTFGAAVVGHRTQNPYFHLLLGCAAFLVLSSIPWIGGMVSFAVAMLAIGALIATRAGGLLEPRKKTPPTGLV